jgi:hypothetical protein
MPVFLRRLLAEKINREIKNERLLDAESKNEVARISFSQQCDEGNNPSSMRRFKACCAQERK